MDSTVPLQGFGMTRLRATASAVTKSNRSIECCAGFTRRGLPRCTPFDSAGRGASTSPLTASGGTATGPSAGVSLAASAASQSVCHHIERLGSQLGQHCCNDSCPKQPKATRAGNEVHLSCWYNCQQHGNGAGQFPRLSTVAAGIRMHSASKDECRPPHATHLKSRRPRAAWGSRR